MMMCSSCYCLDKDKVPDFDSEDEIVDWTVSLHKLRITAESGCSKCAVLNGGIKAALTNAEFEQTTSYDQDDEHGAVARVDLDRRQTVTLSLYLPDMPIPMIRLQYYTLTGKLHLLLAHRALLTGCQTLNLPRLL